MKDETRKRLAALIAEEISEKIKVRDSLKTKLEAFTDLPIDKVAEAILRQFEYLLSSDLRDLIIHLVVQEAQSRESEKEHKPDGLVIEVPSEMVPEPVEAAAPTVEPEMQAQYQPVDAVELPEPESNGSVMTYFGHREVFEVEPIDFELQESDWLYLYGFSYAPESEGKGIPAKKLRTIGIDEVNPLFLLDYGDVRFYLSRVEIEDAVVDRRGRLMLTPKKQLRPQYLHEFIQNQLRSQELIVGFPFWSVTQGRDKLIKAVEDSYVDLLRALIDMHDASEWNVDVSAFDPHLASSPSVVGIQKERENRRETRQSPGKKVDVKLVEKVIFKEKTVAQEIHSHLMIHSTKSRIDHMISLEGAFIDDWKSILSARYNVGKEKRKSFMTALWEMQQEYQELEAMIKLSSPTVRFTLSLP